MRVKVSFGAASGEAVKLVDRFGQSTARSISPPRSRPKPNCSRTNRPKPTWLATLHPPALDTFGGLPGSGAKLGLKRSGFFHVEKKGDRWILVDPDGNAFFHLGICGFNPSDDYTYVAGRERVYEWLPAHDGEFADARFTPTATGTRWPSRSTWSTRSARPAGPTTRPATPRA